MAEPKCVTERSVMIELLETYKENPCLWDTSNNHYRNFKARQEAYEILLKIYRKVIPTATTTDMKKRLDNMRTAFNRECKKVDSSLMDGDGRESPHSPKLWYYKHMSFLNENPSSLPRTTQVIILNDEEESHSKRKVKKKKRRATVSHDEEEQILQEKSPTWTTTAAVATDDSTDSFGRVTGLQLKEMTKIQRCIAEKLISEVLFYGKLEQLTMQSKITNNYAIEYHQLHSPSNEDEDQES